MRPNLKPSERHDQICVMKDRVAWESMRSGFFLGFCGSGPEEIQEELTDTSPLTDHQGRVSQGPAFFIGL